MPIQITTLSLGPVGTNCYLVADAETRQAVVIDPGWDAPQVLARAQDQRLALGAIWLTHAHFDHMGGVAGLVRALDLPVALHSLDLPLYRDLGGAKAWGVPVEAGPEPSIVLDQFVAARSAAGEAPDGGQPAGLEVGGLRFEVRHVPGHTPGHVAFYEPSAGVIFGGDVLFQSGIGRTDFPGGSFETLMHSIQSHFLPLPDSTVVYSGHGPATTIGAERQFNPFL